MARVKNPRRTLLEMLKPTRDRLKWVHDRWSVYGQVSEEYEENGRRNHRWRKRRAEEYPEAQGEEWALAYAQVNKAIEELVQTRDFIARQYRALQTSHETEK